MFWSRTNGAPGNEDALLQQLIDLRTTSRDTNAGAPIYYGLVNVNMTNRLRGVGDLDKGQAALGNISRGSFDYQRHLMAHEFGHALKRPHAVHSAFGRWTNNAGVASAGSVQGHCREYADDTTVNFPMDMHPVLGRMPVLGPLTQGADKQIWGADHYSGTLINPFFWFDVMSYCYDEPGTTEWPWISKYTYTNIQNRVINLWGRGGAPGPAFAEPLLLQYLLVRGQINLLSNTVGWLPAFPFDSDVTPPSPDPGDYALVLLDQFDNVLGQIPFTPRTTLVEFGVFPEAGWFSIPVPLTPDLAHAVITWQGVPLGELTRSANAPVVQVLAPNGGEVFGDEAISVRWISNDADGDPLWHLIQFSPDNGATWETIAIDWDGTSYDIPPDTLPASSAARIRVIASDGLRTGSDTSDGAFVVLNHGPAVAILAPTGGELFFGEQMIVFEATANDLEDGELTGANLQWASDRDGMLGTGAMLLREVIALSEGAHVITVKATDSAGMTNSASVNIVVSYDEPPRLNIAQVLTDVLLWWPSTATNYHLQKATALPGTWSNVTNATQVTDDRIEVTLPSNEAAKFYRLTKPWLE
jgi:hypothetical protein